MRVGLAVSGGADSVALLVLMASLRASHGFEPVVLHFDHGIRKESADDAAFVKRLAARFGLPFHSARVKVARRHPEREFTKGHRKPKVPIVWDVMMINFLNFWQSIKSSRSWKRRNSVQNGTITTCSSPNGTENRCSQQHLMTGSISFARSTVSASATFTVSDTATLPDLSLQDLTYRQLPLI